ncbi:MAG: acyl-CoA dehydrogenase family protein [Pirellulaceae bacterium]
MTSQTRITRPDAPEFEALCQQLASRAADLDQPGAWPAAQLDLCGKFGVFEWFLEPEWGGQDWSEADLVRGYLRLSAACLTTTFVITQRTGACRRIAVSENRTLQQRLLPDLVGGKTFATVGISHLTTSRRHLKRPVLRAEPTERGYLLEGFSPWVTGAPFAQTVVIGATLEDGRQILAALPTDRPGVSTPEPPALVGVSASQTGQLRCDRVEVEHDLLLAGPMENVMQSGAGAKTGGLQTSTLAIGLAKAAVDFLAQEAANRPDLLAPAEALQADWQRTCDDLLAMADGQEVCSNENLRTRANSLVLRCTQAALSAAKGTGYVIGHPAGRWCREALFFLVWSCPQPVVSAHLCELAGISD